MAPRSANRNPETRKPARALPPPGARVSSVLPAKSTVFDCIIPGRQVGQAIAFCGLLGWAFGPRNFMEKVGQAGYPLGPPAPPILGICRRRSRKRDVSRAVASSFSRLRVARGVHRRIVRFWFRGLSALVSCLLSAQFATPATGIISPVAGIFLPLVD